MQSICQQTLRTPCVFDERRPHKFVTAALYVERMASVYSDALGWKQLFLWSKTIDNWTGGHWLLFPSDRVVFQRSFLFLSNLCKSQVCLPSKKSKRPSNRYFCSLGSAWCLVGYCRTCTNIISEFFCIRHRLVHSQKLENGQNHHGNYNRFFIPTLFSHRSIPTEKISDYSLFHCISAVHNDEGNNREGKSLVSLQVELSVSWAVEEHFSLNNLNRLITDFAFQAFLLSHLTLSRPVMKVRGTQLFAFVSNVCIWSTSGNTSAVTSLAFFPSRSHNCSM